MKNNTQIRRGTIVKITDWIHQPLKENKWVVEMKYNKKKTPLALISKITNEKVAPKGQRFSWTIADLKPIGHMKMPKLGIEKALSECKWWVSLTLIIESNGEDAYFKWKAHCQNSWNSLGYTSANGSFKQVDNPYVRTRSIPLCINNWKRFAKRNEIPTDKYDIFPFCTYESRLQMAKLKWCSNEYKDRFYSACNSRNFLLSQLEFSGGMYGGEVLTKYQRQKRREQMKANGDWDRLQVLNKMLTKDLSLVKTFDDEKELKRYRGK